MTNNFYVNGMSCAACQARVEKAVASLDGVELCNVSLLTNSMTVAGSADTQVIIQAVKNVGYDASIVDASFSSAVDARTLVNDAETRRLKRRLITSIALVAAMFAINMGGLISDRTVSGIVQAIIAFAVIIINREFFIRGFKGLLHGSVNMDTLVALGSGISYLWSMHVLISGNGGELYFESSAMILTFITVGKLLESISKGRTTNAIKELLELSPENAIVERGGSELELAVDELVIGDICIVKAGSKIPADGVIIAGDASVNEATLTGESMPVDKSVGDEAMAATICESGYFKLRVTRLGEDTALAGIIKLVTEAVMTKAPIAWVADKISGIFVPLVIGIATIVCVVWLTLGQSISFALSRAIAVLVISCPCALGLATPVAIMVGSGVGAKHGIFFRTAAAMEEMGRVKMIALDKTGTITKGEPTVTDIIPAPGIQEDELIVVAALLEGRSDHPLARAITRGLRTESQDFGEEIEKSMASAELDDYININGRGLLAKLSSQDKAERVAGGNMAFAMEFLDLEDDEEDDIAVIEWMKELANTLGEQGKTVMFWAKGERLLGAIAVADELKSDSAEAISELKDMGNSVVMITGDNEKTARAIATEIGIDKVIAEVLPQGKFNAISKLVAEGKTAMVGDGINDAPALTRADVGIAIGAGSDVAIEAADVVLINSSVKDVVSALKIGRATLRVIHQNLFWAFFYNALLIPLAAGVFTSLLGGWTVSPMLAAAAMSISSFTVCINALRLNAIKL